MLRVLSHLDMVSLQDMGTANDVLYRYQHPTHLDPICINRLIQRYLRLAETLQKSSAICLECRNVIIFLIL